MEVSVAAVKDADQAATAAQIASGAASGCVLDAAAYHREPTPTVALLAQHTRAGCQVENAARRTIVNNDVNNDVNNELLCVNRRYARTASSSSVSAVVQLIGSI